MNKKVVHTKPTVLSAQEWAALKPALPQDPQRAANLGAVFVRHADEEASQALFGQPYGRCQLIATDGASLAAFGNTGRNEPNDAVFPTCEVAKHLSVHPFSLWETLASLSHPRRWAVQTSASELLTALGAGIQLWRLENEARRAEAACWKHLDAMNTAASDLATAKASLCKLGYVSNYRSPSIPPKETRPPHLNPERIFGMRFTDSTDGLRLTWRATRPTNETQDLLHLPFVTFPQPIDADAGKVSVAFDCQRLRTAVTCVLHSLSAKARATALIHISGNGFDPLLIRLAQPSTYSITYLVMPLSR